MRKSKKIPPKKVKYAVVGDGKCEFWYVQMLKRNERIISVDLKPEIPQKKKLSDQFASVLELSRVYDKVFWMVDYDVIVSETRSVKKGAKTAQHEFKEYCDKIKVVNEKAGDENIVVIINHPCLEYWFLLHFESTSKCFSNCESATRQLKKYLSDYEKSQSYYTKEGNDIYLRLRPNLSTAISNAKKIQGFNFNQPNFGISQMQLFFETLGIKEKEDVSDLPVVR